MASPLTEEQLATFATRGWVRLQRAFDPQAALQLQERMWAELREDFGIDRNDRRTWWQPMQSLRRAKRDPAQNVMASERLLGAIDTLLSPVRWRTPTNWGVVLVTFPGSDGEWILPSGGWHFDFELDRNANSLGGLFVFTFFSDVGPRGGGTLIVEGSHRLLRQLHATLSAEERQASHQRQRQRFLHFDPWLETLTGKGPAPEDRNAYFMELREVKGVPVRVVELMGEPGDAILCHPLMLHVAAPNRAAIPRFMRSQRICEATD